MTPQFSRFKTPCFRGLVTERPICLPSCPLYYNRCTKRDLLYKGFLIRLRFTLPPRYTHTHTLKCIVGRRIRAVVEGIILITCAAGRYSGDSSSNILIYSTSATALNELIINGNSNVRLRRNLYIFLVLQFEPVRLTPLLGDLIQGEGLGAWPQKCMGMPPSMPGVCSGVQANYQQLISNLQFTHCRSCTDESLAKVLAEFVH